MSNLPEVKKLEQDLLVIYCLSIGLDPVNTEIKRTWGKKIPSI